MWSPVPDSGRGRGRGWQTLPPNSSIGKVHLFGGFVKEILIFDSHMCGKSDKLRCSPSGTIYFDPTACSNQNKPMVGCNFKRSSPEDDVATDGDTYTSLRAITCRLVLNRLWVVGDSSISCEWNFYTFRWYKCHRFHFLSRFSFIIFLWGMPQGD